MNVNVQFIIALIYDINTKLCKSLKYYIVQVVIYIYVLKHTKFY
jgi:hypothetical protein